MRRSRTQRGSKCTLFNGIDQRSSELRGFCSLLRLIHAFLGNDAHTAITAAAVWMIRERNGNRKEMEEKETGGRKKGEPCAIISGRQGSAYCEEEGGHISQFLEREFRIMNFFLTLRRIISRSSRAPKVLIK